MKRLNFWRALVVGIALTVALSSGVSAAAALETAAAPAVKIVLYGEEMDFVDGVPYLDPETNHIYVSLRHVSEALGATVDWRPETKAAVACLGTQSVEMQVHQSVPLVNGSPGPELPAPARLEQGRLMVPLNFILGVFGYTYTLDGVKEEGLVRVVIPAHAEHRPGTIAISERLIQSLTEEANIELHIPVLSGLPEQALEKEINAEFLQKAEDFRRETVEPFAEYKESREKYGGPVHPFEVVTSYEEHYNQDGLLSISVSYYGYQGGAHGFTIKETLNLDVNTGKKLTLADFFEPAKDVVVEKIQEKIAAEPDLYFEHALETVAEITSEQPFYIEDKQVVIYFALYEIAPYAAGMPEFEIPISIRPASAD